MNLTKMMKMLSEEIELIERNPDTQMASISKERAIWNKAVDVIQELIGLEKPLDIDKEIMVSAENVVKDGAETVEAVKKSAKQVYSKVMSYLKSLKK